MRAQILLNEIDSKIRESKIQGISPTMLVLDISSWELLRSDSHVSREYIWLKCEQQDLTNADKVYGLEVALTNTDRKVLKVVQ